MRFIKRIMLVAVVCVACQVSTALAVLTDVGQSPGIPTVDDTVSVFVRGYAPNTCYEMVGRSFTVVGDTFVHQVDAYMNGLVCFLIIFPWGYSETVGTLPAGTYYVKATEVVQPFLGGPPQVSVMIDSFTVVSCEDCISGDVDVDGEVTVADISLLVDYLFLGGPALPCPDRSDVDGSQGSSEPNVADLAYLVEYLFHDGPEPLPCS